MPLADDKCTWVGGGDSLCVHRVVVVKSSSLKRKLYRFLDFDSDGATGETLTLPELFRSCTVLSETNASVLPVTRMTGARGDRIAFTVARVKHTDLYKVA